MIWNTFRATSLGLGLAMLASHAFAAASDYEFQAISKDIKAGTSVELAVRLIHKPTKKPVSGAVLFRTRLDMSPDGMDDMATTIAPDGAGEAGVYRFKTDLSMAGNWALKLMAKVPGERETVQGTVVFTSKD